jgi:hypothetical protein
MKLFSLHSILLVFKNYQLSVSLIANCDNSAEIVTNVVQTTAEKTADRLLEAYL